MPPTRGNLELCEILPSANNNHIQTAGIWKGSLCTELYSMCKLSLLSPQRWTDRKNSFKPVWRQIIHTFPVLPHAAGAEQWPAWFAATQLIQLSLSTLSLLHSICLVYTQASHPHRQTSLYQAHCWFNKAPTQVFQMFHFITYSSTRGTFRALECHYKHSAPGHVPSTLYGDKNTPSKCQSIGITPHF